MQTENYKLVPQIEESKKFKKPFSRQGYWAEKPSHPKNSFKAPKKPICKHIIKYNTIEHECKKQIGISKEPLSSLKQSSMFDSTDPFAVKETH